MGGMSTAQIFGLPEPRREFLWLSVRGKCQSDPGEGYGVAAPYSPCLAPSEFMYVAVSSTGVKIRDRRKERRKKVQNKTKKTALFFLNNARWVEQDSRE